MMQIQNLNLCFVEWKGKGGSFEYGNISDALSGGEYLGAENVKGFVVVSTNALCRTSNE
jgi:hypothetical protein